MKVCTMLVNSWKCTPNEFNHNDFAMNLFVISHRYNEGNSVIYTEHGTVVWIDLCSPHLYTSMCSTPLCTNTVNSSPNCIYHNTHIYIYLYNCNGIFISKVLMILFIITFHLIKWRNFSECHKSQLFDIICT